MENNTKNIKIGFLTRVLISLVIVFYLLSNLNKNFNLIYGNITLFTFSFFEIYRMITGIFISDNWVDCLFSIFVLFTILNYTENREGTVKTAIRMLIYTISLQLFVNIAILLMYLFHPIVLSNIVKPLPAIGLSLIIRNILLTDAKHIQIYKNIEFNNRWLLIFTFITFLVVNYNEFKVEALISMPYGFFICKFQNYLDYPIDDEKILHFEKNERFKSIFNMDGWIPIEQQYTQALQQTDTKPIDGTKDDIEIIDVDI
jgi:hypothetical protein